MTNVTIYQYIRLHFYEYSLIAHIDIGVLILTFVDKECHLVFLHLERNVMLDVKLIFSLNLE